MKLAPEPRASEAQISVLPRTATAVSKCLRMWSPPPSHSRTPVGPPGPLMVATAARRLRGQIDVAVGRTRQRSAGPSAGWRALAAGRVPGQELVGVRLADLQAGPPQERVLHVDLHPAGQNSQPTHRDRCRGPVILS